MNFYKSDNRYKHKNSDSLYAHYSMIDVPNHAVYPNFQFATPIRFKVRKGESLYIPKRWWHWIKTTQKTFAINYWFNNTNPTQQEPFMFSHTIACGADIMDNEVVWVWNSEKNYDGDRNYQQKFNEFYNSQKSDACVITLSNYMLGENNAHIKRKISNYITFPNDERFAIEHPYDYNLWFCSDKHDTGLHYDDEDGVLTVVEGEKDVTLFSPSDTQYLYPYDVNYEWKQAPATNFKYNAFKELEEVGGVCSGELLYVTCNGDMRALSNITKLFYEYQHTNLIWGFKKHGNVYRWEIYYYTLHNDIKITSWDIHQNEYDIPKDEHYYYQCERDSNKLPFWGYGKQKKGDVLLDESVIFVLDSCESFYRNYDSYMDRLGYSSIKRQYEHIILQKYRCYQLCIHNKNPNQIFVQYLGISNDDFLQFLKKEKYPDYVVEFVEENIKLNNYRINNEITIVYDIETQEVIRSGFYGNL